jgi:hypothetical protein
MSDPTIDRLLRSAAKASADEPIAMPFGFDTRVVALRHSGSNTDVIGLTRLLQHVALIAAVVLIIAGAGIYNESTQTSESSEPFANEFAIADSAIQSEFQP